VAYTRGTAITELRSLIDDPVASPSNDGDRWTFLEAVAHLNANMRILAEALPPGELESISSSAVAGVKDTSPAQNNFLYPTGAAQIHSVVIDFSATTPVGIASQWVMPLSNDVIDGIADRHPDFLTTETVGGTAKVVQAFYSTWQSKLRVWPRTAVCSLTKENVTVHSINYPTQFSTTTGTGDPGDAETTNLSDNLLVLAIKGAARDALTKDSEAAMKAQLQSEWQSTFNGMWAKYKADKNDPIYTKQFTGFTG